MKARRQGLRLRWAGGDRLGLTVLTVAWAPLLGWTWLARPCVPAADAAAVEAVRERIDPNTASAASLRRLPGIDSALAAAVIDHRRRQARTGIVPAFRSIDDLDDVPGIGAKKLQRIRSFLTVHAPPTAGSAPAPTRP